MSSTGSAERAASAPAKLRARAAATLSESSTLYGRPTTSTAGRHSRITASTASQGTPRDPQASARACEALRLTVSPQATPMRRCPKSNARTICGACSRADGASGITADRADEREIDAQYPPGPGPARFERHVEDEARIHRGAEPGVRPDLVLELPA